MGKDRAAIVVEWVTCGRSAFRERKERVRARKLKSGGKVKGGPKGVCCGCGGPHWQSECPNGRIKGRGEGGGNLLDPAAHSLRQLAHDEGRPELLDINLHGGPLGPAAQWGTRA